MSSCLKEETLQAYHDGELPVKARGPVRAHLIGCASCSAVAFGIEKQLADIGSALSADLSQSVPTVRLRAHIHELMAFPVPAESSVMERLWPALWVAVSALVIVAFMTSHAPKRRVADSPPPAHAPAHAEDALATHQTTVVTVSQPLRQRHRARASNNTSAEPVTQFFPLLEPGGMPTESLRLVRIELPKSAMAELGLTIDPETAGRLVTADVILGDDGLARAIRFVR
jgi:hypothetical protein